jgi:hypothetical protein
VTDVTRVRTCAGGTIEHWIGWLDSIVDNSKLQGKSQDIWLIYACNDMSSKQVMALLLHDCYLTGWSVPSNAVLSCVVLLERLAFLRVVALVIHVNGLFCATRHVFWRLVTLVAPDNRLFCCLFLFLFLFFILANCHWLKIGICGKL